ncbi:MAG: pyridoxal phosphate-dependent aminotransferase, partial [Planctomycetes bacterium]|nr:pyridoxal phosphate-dependent aminotransferase [Planctomycetota bacterium]
MALSSLPYMRWAKSEATLGELKLTSSAVPALDWSELGFDPRELELARYSRYGEPEMLERIGARWRVPPENVLLASSTTHAHFCFAASGLEPGDRILVEAPGYTPIVDALSLLKLQVVPYRRTFESGFALPREELRDLCRSLGPRMVLVTHLHNPSGVALTADEARFLGDLCDEFGIEVLSDEIYRPFLPADDGPLHAVHPSIISVWGLNKVHGLPLI